MVGILGDDVKLSYAKKGKIENIKICKGEDVVTANTMLLPCLYYHSSNSFFRFKKEKQFGDIVFEPQLLFILQNKSEKSVPDATITQASFKMIIETKLTDGF